MATRKPLQGVKYRWEEQPVEQGAPMEGTDLSRGSIITLGDGTKGVVLGLSDNGEYVGVKFDFCQFVTEYTVEQFAQRFACHAGVD